jgi:hypothetical protein
MCGEPLPGAAGDQDGDQGAARPVIEFPTKKAAFLSRYRAHPEYGNRSAAGRADTVLGRHYGGYELRECWPGHIHAVWELSTLAAAWHNVYGGGRPDLARALEFYDRWLPGTMRRIAHITRTCISQCDMFRRSW